jgi:hypothetical protein
MRILADFEGRIQREAAMASCHEKAEQDGNSLHTGPHLPAEAQAHRNTTNG